MKAATLTTAPAAGSLRFEHLRALLARRQHRELEDVTDADVLADLEERRHPREPGR